MDDLRNEEMESKRRGIMNTINACRFNREQSEKVYGQVWDTEQLKAEFQVHGFLAPFVAVTRLSDGKKGSLTFQHMPRFYFAWSPDEA